jgi:hypothetical protein
MDSIDKTVLLIRSLLSSFCYPLSDGFLFLSLIHAYMRSLLSHHLYSSPSFSLKVINLVILDSVTHLFVLPFSFEME